MIPSLPSGRLSPDASGPGPSDNAPAFPLHFRSQVERPESSEENVVGHFGRVTTRRRGSSNGFHDGPRRKRNSRRTITVVEIGESFSVATDLHSARKDKAAHQVLVAVRLDEPDVGLLSSGGGDNRTYPPGQCSVTGHIPILAARILGRKTSCLAHRISPS